MAGPQATGEEPSLREALKSLVIKHGKERVKHGVDDIFQSATAPERQSRVPAPVTRTSDVEKENEELKQKVEELQKELDAFRKGPTGGHQSGTSNPSSSSTTDLARNNAQSQATGMATQPAASATNQGQMDTRDQEDTSKEHHTTTERQQSGNTNAPAEYSNGAADPVTQSTRTTRASRNENPNYNSGNPSIRASRAKNVGPRAPPQPEVQQPSRSATSDHAHGKPTDSQRALLTRFEPFPRTIKILKIPSGTQHSPFGITLRKWQRVISHRHLIDHLDNRECMPRADPKPRFESRISVAEVVVDGHSKFGKVSSGYIEVSGLTRKLVETTPARFPRTPEWRFRDEFTLYHAVASGKAIATCWTDWKVPVKQRQWMEGPEKAGLEGLQMLVLHRVIAYPKDPVRRFGLLLLPRGDKGKYIRVGIFEVCDEEFFEEGEQQMLRIV